MRKLLIHIFAAVSTSSCSSKVADQITIFDACRHYGAKLALLIACFAFAGCNTTAKHHDGTPWFTTYMNARTFYAKSGEDVFYVDGMDHATPTDVASDGITDALATAASGAFALQNPTTTGAAVLLAPHVTPRVMRPPRRARPTPTPSRPVGVP